MGVFDFFKKNKTAEVNVTKLLKTVNDCAAICNTTTKPDVFFTKYDLLMGTLHQLSTLEGKTDFPGPKPSETFQTVSAQRDQQTALFIERYYQESRAFILGEKEMKVSYNPAEKFKANLHLYKSYLSPENKEDVLRLYQVLRTLK